MPARKRISLSLSDKTLETIDELSAEEGMSRSEWVEQVVSFARRQAALARAVAEYERETGRTITADHIEAMRREIYGEVSEPCVSPAA